METLTTTLIANAGSSSRRYALFVGDAEVLRGTLEREESGNLTLCLEKDGTILRTSTISEEQFTHGPETFIAEAVTEKSIASADTVTSIAVRLVAPGVYFAEHRLVDTAFLEALRRAEELDPVHIGPTILEIETLMRLCAHATIVAISDSAFHSTMPECAASYALPKSLRDRGFRRYGYHGISCASIIRKLQEQGDSVPERLIIAHLGNGASVTAVKQGASVDTSMGYSPLEGLPMSTRVGTIDAGAVLSILEADELSREELRKLLYRESGLKGLSDLSYDMRVLIAEEEKNAGAALAIATFVQSVKKYIGAYTATLGGLDALVFTGTMGERSSIIRGRICEGLEFLGVSLDEEKNKVGNAVINKEGAGVRVIVQKTEELSQMLTLARQVLRGSHEQN